MKIQVIDFTKGNIRKPVRKHYNDAGADVYVLSNYTLAPHTVTKIPLGFGLKIPDGLMGNIFPRSGLSDKGIVCQLPPIDSGYRGEIHAIVANLSDVPYSVNAGERIGQIVISPIVLAEFVDVLGEDRGSGAFGSTGV